MKNSRFLYQMVYEEIKSDIIGGVLAPGTKICPEKQLSIKYGLSTITVKTALGLLTEEGLVRRVPGKGTYVADPVKSPTPLNKEQAGSTENRHILGVVFEHVSSPFGLDMMYHMDRIAMEKGYRLCIRFSYTDQMRETEEIDFLLSLGVCGLIIMPSHGDHYNTKILKLVIDDFPVVLIDKNLSGIPVPAVYTDNDQCARMLINHLVDRGYKDIGLIASPSNGISSIKGRRKGFYEGIEAHSLMIHEECIVKLKVDAICVTGKLMAEQNAKIICDYLSKHPAIDSLVCLESGFLPDIYEACRQLGLRIPEDIAVCSFDEDNGSSTGYFFTHVKQDEIAIAEKAMELIDSMISNKSHEKIMNYKIPGIFREGKTTRERTKKE